MPLLAIGAGEGLFVVSFEDLDLHCDGIAVLGKIFRGTQGLQVIDHDSLRYICRDFSVIALCFERGLLQYS